MIWCLVCFIGALRAVVTDGLDIGHVCCGVHDCQNRLESQRERFCHTHKPRELVCAVKNCEAPVEQLFKTCCDPVHRELENRGEESRTALFQLKRRLERAKSSQTNDSLAFERPDDDPVELDCPDKAETGNVAPQKSQKIQISLGRCWTHNEELCVGCCGMIFGRATFYGSEAPNAVRVCESFNDLLVIDCFSADIPSNTVPNTSLSSWCYVL